MKFASAFITVAASGLAAGTPIARRGEAYSSCITGLLDSAINQAIEGNPEAISCLNTFSEGINTKVLPSVTDITDINERKELFLSGLTSAYDNLVLCLPPTEDNSPVFIAIEGVVDTAVSDDALIGCNNKA